MRTEAFGSLFSSILCPIDFSEHSRLALRHAVHLAQKSHGRVTVLFVNDPLLVAAAAAAYDGDTLGAATQEELTRFVDESLTRTEHVRIDYRTALGKPGREILRIVDEGQHDAVVLGAKGLNAAQRLFLGSTTSDVLRRTKIPVLAITMTDPQASAPDVPPDWPGQRLLAPIAMDEHAESDLGRAAAVASWFGASLDVLHVVPVPSTPAWFRGNMQGQLYELGEKARAALGALTASLDVDCATVIATGYPPDQIGREAAERRSGLVVMTLRGGDGVLGGAVGKTVYGVLTHAVAPVLALPPVERPST